MSISASPAKVRLRYPFRAILVVGLAALLASFNLLAGSLFLMPMIPLIPVFIMLMIGNACLLSSALSYARSVARPVGGGFEPAKAPILGKLPSPHAEISDQAERSSRKGEPAASTT